MSSRILWNTILKLKYRLKSSFFIIHKQIEDINVYCFESELRLNRIYHIVSHGLFDIDKMAILNRKLMDVTTVRNNNVVKKFSEVSSFLINPASRWREMSSLYITADRNLDPESRSWNCYVTSGVPDFSRSKR